MERSLSQEERIRRAEEIYFNRRGERNRTRESSVSNTEQKNSSVLLKKMLLQILICFVIYFILFLIKDTEYGFSENVLKQVDTFLNDEINWGETFQFVQEEFGKMNERINQFGIEMQSDEEGVDQSQEGTNVQTENQEELQTQENEIPENTGETVTEEQIPEDNGVGGGIEESQDTNLSQMEIDANYVKKNYSLMLPLEGSITSQFGARTPTDIVSANHCGTDIGAVTGTEIKSIMDGTVTLVSTEGDYGKHVKIENGEVSVLYAHCSELDVTEGQEVKMGDCIAKVGSTGKATGPHLHIEIKREDRYIDPETVLPF